MKRVIYLTIVFVLTLMSCEKDGRGADEQGSKSVDVDLSFVVSNYLGAQSSSPVKSGEVPLVGDFETGVDSMWALQFNEAGALVMKKFSKNIRSNPEGVKDRFSATVLIDATKSTTLYLVANVAEALYSSLSTTTGSAATLTNFLEIKIPYDQTAATKMPKMGIVKGFITAVSDGGLVTVKATADGTAGTPAAIEIFPLLAKVVFEYSVASGFQIDASKPKGFEVTEVTIGNAPNEINTDIKTTAKDAEETLLTTATSYTGKVLSSLEPIVPDPELLDSKKAGTYTFYMPENIGGVGTGNTHDSEKLGLATSNTASYIELKGKYKTTHSGTAVNENVAFKIYLGGACTAVAALTGVKTWDFLNGYNVRAGYSYKVTLPNIDNINAADERITITTP